MLSEAELPALYQQVLWAALVLGVALGAITQRSHFCTMGALSDVVAMGDWTRMRMWALAVGVAVIGFHVQAGMGWISPQHTFYADATLSWLSMLVGGLLFGFGMVLASGCGNKTLVRLGAGNLKALVVLLVMGLAAWATLKGVTALWRHQWLDPVRVVLPGGQDLARLAQASLGGSLVRWTWGLGLGGGLVAVAWAIWPRAAEQGRRPVGALAAGAAVGVLAAAAWGLTGIWAHVAEHPTTLQEAFLTTASQRMEALSFVAPSAQLLEYVVFASDKSRQLGFGVVVLLGVVLGSAAAAWRGRSFRWEGFGGVGDLARHLVGAVLMGVGGVTAMGCTFGQGISGLSTLSVGSVLAVAAILAGGWLGLRWQMWQLERSA